MNRPLCGIFVGGASRRMNGHPKGLLPCEPGGETIVGRLVRIVQALELPVVLVGQHEAYRPLGLPMLADQPPGVGPLGGLCALLRHAQGREVLALACDMPFVSQAFLERFLALECPDADVVIAQTGPGAPLETFLARYRATALPTVLQKIAEGERTLQRVLHSLNLQTVLLPEADQTVCQDWDTEAELPPALKHQLPPQTNQTHRQQ
ncbi:MAG TPA: molybdenum cofactor guanylyltransferase [Pseudomonadota bacterium]|nr:molybdenum cofactor guanylyltransferase [Pseudomonadota bacterium]